MLPVEIFAAIISFCDKPTWVSACSVSKASRSIALPLLHNCKKDDLYDPRKAVLFLRVPMVNPLAVESVRELFVRFGNRKSEETQCLSGFCRLVSKALPRAVNLVVLNLDNGKFGSQVHCIEHYFYT
ncbi:hypothetical protein WG66_004051, partial [Moniliophthora roreri]